MHSYCEKCGGPLLTSVERVLGVCDGCSSTPAPAPKEVPQGHHALLTGTIKGLGR